jgi:hypothetical protein
MLSKKSSEASLRRNPSSTIMMIAAMTTIKVPKTDSVQILRLLSICSTQFSSLVWSRFAIQFLLAWEARCCRSSSFP